MSAVVRKPRDAVLAVGVNVQRLRGEQGLSLSALARRSNVAKATLSALESGHGNPTVATLDALSRALQVPVHELLSRGAGPLQRLVRGRRPERPGTDDILVDTFAPRGSVQVYDLRYEPGSQFRFDAHTTGTRERVLVHEGRLRVGPLDAVQELGEGDYLAFNADVVHLYEAAGRTTVRAVLVVCYPGTAPSSAPVHSESRM
ncbi:MAG TPA: XRE family transcriptional regulator [Nitriliruptorales bacterium]|nr:XRE family transcriptional regulator [Nitriliruptorales bacterium]